MDICLRWPFIASLKGVRYKPESTAAERGIFRQTLLCLCLCRLALLAFFSVYIERRIKLYTLITALIVIGIYVVWIGAFVAGILNLIRSCYYCTLTVSSIEGEP